MAEIKVQVQRVMITIDVTHLELHNNKYEANEPTN